MKTKSIIAFGVFLLVLMASPAFADYLWVGHCGGYPVFYSIQEAVDAAYPYDTVIVCPKYGCYDEDVVINNDGHSREGLTLKSTEIPDCGPMTCVNSITIGDDPNDASHVTVKGFSVNPCKNNGVGIESFTSYNTIAFNHVYGCVEQFAGSGAAIRVNAGADGNDLHHNLVDWCSGTTSGIGFEVDGRKHNSHQNCVMGCKENGIRIQSDHSQTHQDQVVIYEPAFRGILIEGDHNAAHHDEVCDGMYSDSIDLFFGSEHNFIHHDTVTGKINDSNPSDDTTNREFKNHEQAECPFEELGCCNGAAADMIW